MRDLDDWTADVVAALGLPNGVDVEGILQFAADAAHAVMRSAAPLTTYLVGLAAGRAGGDPEELDRIVAVIGGLLASRAES